MDTHNKLCMINLKQPFRTHPNPSTFTHPCSARGPHYTVIYFTRREALSLFADDPAVHHSRACGFPRWLCTQEGQLT